MYAPIPRTSYSTLGITLMVLRKCDFCYEERECQKYEPDGWICDRCQYIALFYLVTESAYCDHVEQMKIVYTL